MCVINMLPSYNLLLRHVYVHVHVCIYTFSDNEGGVWLCRGLQAGGHEAHYIDIGCCICWNGFGL